MSEYAPCITVNLCWNKIFAPLLQGIKKSECCIKITDARNFGCFPAMPQKKKKKKTDISRSCFNS
jgi:hypothetical protein